MASPASFQHEAIQSLLLTVMRNFVDAHGLGMIMGPNTAYRLSEQNVFQPDVSFITRERVHLAEEVYFPGPPDIAVEIVSPSSRHYDTIEKKINYGRFGVSEYWLIDPLDESITFFGQIGGELVPYPEERGRIHSQVLPGFWLERSWVFPKEGQSRPGVIDIARAQGIL